MVKTPHFQCRECGFNPWSGNEDITCCMVQPKSKIIIIITKCVVFTSECLWKTPALELMLSHSHYQPGAVLMFHYTHISKLGHYFNWVLSVVDCIFVKFNWHLHCTIALISHASKVMLKILQARLQPYVNFQMFRLNLEKAEEPEIKLPASIGS